MLRGSLIIYNTLNGLQLIVYNFLLIFKEHCSDLIYIMK
jgi:hypothetical protein